MKTILGDENGFGLHARTLCNLSYSDSTTAHLMNDRIVEGRG
jgi:hypothetical protein